MEQDIELRSHSYLAHGRQYRASMSLRGPLSSAVTSVLVSLRMSSYEVGREAGADLQ